MRVKIKVALILVIVLGSCVVLTALIMSRRPRGDEETVSEHIKPETTVDHQDSWPMFRGGQQLLGRASGSLPDSLKFVWKFKTGDQIKSSPAIEGNLVFIGSSDANVYAIDLES